MSFTMKSVAVKFAGAMGLSVLVATALAQDATGPGVEAINRKKSAIPRNLSGYYSQPVNRQPQVGSAGGAFQYFRGPQGMGAIFWSSVTQAHIVYGELLEYYEENGMEDVIGYPVSDPLRGPGPGCPGSDVVLRQEFVPVSARSGGSRLAVGKSTLCQKASGEVYDGEIIVSSVRGR